jgi:UDP-N-acetyl-D-galactosamine dehydrogenase
VADIVAELRSYGVAVSLCDPVAKGAEVVEVFGLPLTEWRDLPRGDALIVAVAHRAFKSISMAAIGEKLVPGGCFIDVKSQFDRAALEKAGFRVWRL